MKNRKQWGLDWTVIALVVASSFAVGLFWVFVGAWIIDLIGVAPW